MMGPSISRLDNGMTVIIQENHASPVAAFNVWVGAGSGHERDNEAGICHVIEHMLFKGTSRREVGQIASEIESAGGDLNAYTTLDYTVYYVVLASRFFDTGLDVQADAVINSSFDPLEMEREKEVVLEEIKRGDDIPSRKLGQELFAHSYVAHPYRRPVIGYRETVERLTRKRIVDFYRKWYVGENITLVVVGDIDRVEALKKIGRAFKDLRPGKQPRRQRPAEPAQKTLRAFAMAEEVEETYLELAFHTPGVKSKDLYPLDILAVALGQGESSVLFRTVKSAEGLVHNIYSYAYTPVECGLFIVSGTLDLDRTEKALGRILEECFSLSHVGVTKDDLERAKANLESDFIYQKETVQGQARELGYLHCVMGDVGYEKEYLERIKRVSTEDVRRVTREYMAPSNLTVGMLHPGDGKARDVKATIVSAVKKASTSGRRVKVTRSPWPGSVKKEGETVKMALDNGITLLVRENRNCPLVALKGVLKGGVRYESDSNSGISNFIAEMLTKGTRKRTALQIAQETEAVAGHLDGFTGRNSMGVSGEFLSRHFEKGLDLVADVLLHPTFPKSEVEKTRLDIFSSLRQQQDNLMQLTFLEFVRTLYTRHPYRLNVQGTFESVAALKRVDLAEYYKEIGRPENLVFSVVGDVAREEVVERVKEHFRDMEPGGVRVPAIPHEPPIRKPRRREIYKEKEQAHIVLGFLGARMTDPGRYPLVVLNAILSGQGGRLFIELRDRMSLAYSVTSFSQEGIDPGYFGVYMGTSPEKIDLALKTIERELERLVERRVSKEELARAKKFVTGNYEIELQRCSSQCARLAFYESYGLGHQEMFRYADRIMRVSAGEVQEVARRYLDPGRSALVIVRPAPQGERGDDLSTQ